MIKTIWVNAYFVKKGRWETYEEDTGETKKGLFGGEKPVVVKKKRWIELDEYRQDMIDGARLSRDIEKVLNQLESEGYYLLEITPVISGHYSWERYAWVNGSSAPDTCASWGYSYTQGVMVTARKNETSTTS